MLTSLSLFSFRWLFIEEGLIQKVDRGITLFSSKQCIAIGVDSEGKELISLITCDKMDLRQVREKRGRGKEGEIIEGRKER